MNTNINTTYKIKYSDNFENIIFVINKIKKNTNNPYKLCYKYFSLGI